MTVIDLSLTYNILRGFSIKSLCKHSHNKYIDKEWHKQGNGGFDEKIKVCFSYFWFLWPVYITRLEKDKQNKICLKNTMSLELNIYPKQMFIGKILDQMTFGCHILNGNICSFNKIKSCWPSFKTILMFQLNVVIYKNLFMS